MLCFNEREQVDTDDNKYPPCSLENFLNSVKEEGKGCGRWAINSPGPFRNTLINSVLPLISLNFLSNNLVLNIPFPACKLISQNLCAIFKHETLLQNKTLFFYRIMKNFVYIK